MKPHFPVRLGVSSCLLGQKVRYDGGHKRDRFVTDILGKYFELVPVCPEVAIGLGVPRPPIRLVGNPRAPRAVGVEDSTLDVTNRLAAYGRRQARALNDLDGYLFKSRSPSCGVTGVKVFPGRGRVKSGRGVYAAAFLGRLPWLPAEEEDRLGDPRRRDNFLERVFARRRWRALAAGGLAAARLAAFHAAHELQLRAHGEAHWRALGRLAARGRAQAYLAGFLRALARPATRARHAKALAYAAGRLRDRLTPAQRSALRAAIGHYRAGRLPLAAPVRLLRRPPDPWAANQAYLHPDPREFRLRYRA